ncbi:hypothetical protein Anas_11523 [Armadillidium nasatum]|uniref:Uncharacterized protein n=1 Tax=Armadillidium nasatum TaxID=96803 RepID=A0A5N5T084_9CRUS|nr:hypothetical protein Anas_11523 [Armadillidium nasatum]
MVVKIELIYRIRGDVGVGGRAQKTSHLLMKAQNKNIYLTQEALFPEPLKWIIYFRAYPALYLNWTINGTYIAILYYKCIL